MYFTGGLTFGRFSPLYCITLSVFSCPVCSIMSVTVVAARDCGSPVQGVSGIPRAGDVFVEGQRQGAGVDAAARG